MGSFYRVKAGRPFKHVGSLHAYDKEMAMQSARDLFKEKWKMVFG